MLFSVNFARPNPLIVKKDSSYTLLKMSIFYFPDILEILLLGEKQSPKIERMLFRDFKIISKELSKGR